ncbi:glutathione S-transferase family protein [Shimia abyssi]|uniref:Glutathione S-transferase n=1 Tax=Shimia abyssi TaxID=1662395 RepID=A0A2P8F934_9RHOB|nr:glutathione S-transferase [Shimia abyssi]PSL18208.1 glutathione S-transferase [Shimia abyssi]
MQKPTLYHIPVCPFSQRLEILLALKGMSNAVSFHVVDITKPRDPELLEKTRGTTALPVLELSDGRILKESLVILRYLDEVLGVPVARTDPMERAIERMIIAKEAPFTMAGYIMVMNQDKDARAGLCDKILGLYADLGDYLDWQNPGGIFLFDNFGLAEAVFTPMFMRFWFLEYFEDFDLPDDPKYARARAWRAACMAHPAAQQVTKEEIVKLYYDYALGRGNGALPEGRKVSSFTFDTDWRSRPWPPKDKWAPSPSDAALGLVC